MVKFLPVIFFLGFLQFWGGFSKVPVFFVSPVFIGITGCPPLNCNLIMLVCLNVSRPLDE